MKKNWKYGHIIDLEYFLHQDEETDPQKRHVRDRNILLDYQKNTDQSGEQGQLPHRELVKIWLNERTSKEFAGTDQRSPGTIFMDTLLLTKNISVFKGILLGLIAGFSFFTYSGTTPVNVFHFLLFFVVPQLLFMLFLVAACLVRLRSLRVTLPSFYSILFRNMATRLIALLHKQWLAHFTADKRGSISHAFGIIKSQSKSYGLLFYWPLFIVSQLFSIGFNIGLLAVTLLKIMTSDLAFGWQSTLQLSTISIYQSVKALAFPWSWFLPQTTSYPSLAEIEGSRIILKEGIYNLATQNLIAWWPFLVCCLFFYGLTLRYGLLFVGKMLERRALASLRLDTPPCVSLAQRMQTPLVSTQAKPEKTPSKNQTFPTITPDRNRETTEYLLSQVVLIPDDIFALCPVESLAPAMQNNGLLLQEVHKFMEAYETDQELKLRLANRNWTQGEGLLLLMEGWMPPLLDFLTYLKQLRLLLPENTIINLALIGKPGQTVFTPVTSGDFSVWQDKIAAIGDPYLNLFSLLPDHRIS
jgi:hypothetical protein